MVRAVMMRFRLLLLLLTGLLLCPLPVAAQTPPKPATTHAASPPEHLILLRSRLERRATISKELAEVRKALAKTPPPTPEEKARLEGQEKELTEEFDAIESEVGRELTGVDELAPSASVEVDLRKQFEEVVRPALDFLNDLMEQPREIEKLRRGVEEKNRQIVVLRRALDGLEKTKAEAEADKSGADNKALLAEIKSYRDRFQRELTIRENERTVLDRRRSELLAERQSFGQYAGKLWSGFVLNRLLNLLLALLAFGGVLFTLRWVRRWLTRRGLFKSLGTSPFVARFADVIFHVFAVLAALGAAFVVLWISGDWLLLTLTMLIVAGLVLLSRHTLPRLYEQLRIIMNLGGVREGERVIWRGLPWLVKRLHFYSELQNPSLTGGSIRLPIRDMTGLLSRPFGQKERWFPTEEGDWIELNDGTFGKVVLQTPEFVQVVPLGGSFKTYNTVDFLNRTPRNLSHNFRVQSRFGVDYRNTAAVLGDAMQVLAASLQQGYRRLVAAEDILKVNVELLEAASSSLDLLVLADFSGKAAPQFQALHRLTQRLCLETAAEQGWTVAFRQVVVHRAENAAEASAAAAASEDRK